MSTTVNKEVVRDYITFQQQIWVSFGQDMPPWPPRDDL